MTKITDPDQIKPGRRALADYQVTVTIPDDDARNADYVRDQARTLYGRFPTLHAIVLAYADALDREAGR